MSKVSFEDSSAKDTEYADTAAKIVNDAINDAIRTLEKTYADQFGFTLADPSIKEKLDEITDDKAAEIDRTKTPLLIDSDSKKEVPNIKWMTIDNFGKEVAESKIDEYIKNVNFLHVLHSPQLRSFENYYQFQIITVIPFC